MVAKLLLGVEVVRSLYLDEGNGQATVTVTLKASDSEARNAMAALTELHGELIG